MMSDPIADMLTRLRNAQMMAKPTVSFPNSRLKRGILEVLQEEGYITGYAVSGNSRTISVDIKYYARRPVIESIRRLSRPGLRRYVSGKNIPLVKNGLGIAVLSTSKGIVSDHKARELGVGGELLCEVC